MKKILIAEDDPMLADIYSRKFEIGGFEVILASTGLEAVNKARETKPDVILLDLVLPEIDGFEALKQIREDKNLDKTKIIISSNLSQEDERQRAEDLGANGFITKANFTPQEMIEKVQEALLDN